METLYIVLGIIVGLVVLFFLINRIYRSKTIDKGLEKKVANGAILLDVRTEREFRKGHIKDSQNISLGTIKERYIELDPSQTYITYCSHGIRSMEVKAILKNKGFRKVFNGGAMSDLEDIIEKSPRQQMILVFKTTVSTETQVQELKPYLDQLFPLSKWSFDLEDCDGIFRIETTKDKCLLIEFVFVVCGFNCEELE